jgi:uncharacterized membrane protein
MKSAVAIKILSIIYIVGLVGFLIPQTTETFAQLTAATILFTFTFLCFYHRDWTLGFLLAFAVIAICGFLVEYVGVETGYIFGRYQYGNNLGFKVMGIPLIKGVNWFLLIYTTRTIAEKITRKILPMSLIASTLMVVFDYFLETFAINYDLWTWNIGTPPLHNFVGWFIISLLIHLAYAGTRKQSDNPLSIPIFVIQLVFFATIAFWKGFAPYIPA